MVSALSEAPSSPPLPTVSPRVVVRRRLDRALFPVASYVASRALLLIVAGATAVLSRRSLLTELTGFDGQWYLKLARSGYPTHVSHAQTTLGFFPGYPLAIRAFAWLLHLPFDASALVLALAGGLVATVLVHRLAQLWWGDIVARRATVVFVLFPGSVVFVMAYSECLTIPLALGCLLALRERRWLVAGLLAGVATSVGPVALVLIPVCAIAVGRYWREGRPDAMTRLRSLVAPVLSPVGVGSFGLFLWAWTGSPFASMVAQHYGWYEQSNPLGVLGQPVVRHLIAHPTAVLGYLSSWNLWSDIAGAVFLLVSVVLLVRVRHELSPGTIAWTFGVGLMTLWSVMTPPNPRLLLVAAPSLLVWARRLRPRGVTVFIAVEVLLLVAMSALTFSGHMLP